MCRNRLSPPGKAIQVFFNYHKHWSIILCVYILYLQAKVRSLYICAYVQNNCLFNLYNLCKYTYNYYNYMCSKGITHHHKTKLVFLNNTHHSKCIPLFRKETKVKKKLKIEIILFNRCSSTLLSTSPTAAVPNLSNRYQGCSNHTTTVNCESNNLM